MGRIKHKHLKAVFAALMMAVGLGIAVPTNTYAAMPAIWTSHPAPNDATASLQSIEWSPKLKLFVAVGSGLVMSSPDGINWTPRVAPALGWRDITWSSDREEFLAVGDASADEVITSTDGVNWVSHPLDASVDRTWLAVTWSHEQMKYVAAGLSGGSAMSVSSDGINWTMTKSTDATRPSSSTDIVWSAHDSQYVVSSTLIAAFTSPDAIGTWAQRTLPMSASRGIAYAEDKDVYVIAGINGIVTSKDGVTWTTPPQPPAFTNFYDVTYSPENGEFVAAGPDGIASSVDGATWTGVVSPAANTWRGLVWSAALSRYVGVAGTGSNRILVGIVPTVPSPPLNLGATLNGKNVNLSWNTPTFDGNSAITGYHIERSMNGGAFEAIVANTGSPAISYTDTTTSPETSYVYRIFALNAQGQSTVSNTATVQIGAVLANTGLNHYSLIAIAMLLTTVGLMSVWHSMKLRSS